VDSGSVGEGGEGSKRESEQKDGGGGGGVFLFVFWVVSDLEGGCKKVPAVDFFANLNYCFGSFNHVFYYLFELILLFKITGIYLYIPISVHTCIYYDLLLLCHDFEMPEVSCLFVFCYLATYVRLSLFFDL